MLVQTSLEHYLCTGPSSPERPALTVEIPIEDAATAERFKAAAGAAMRDPLPDTAVVVCVPDLLDRLMALEPHLKCGLDLCKLVAGSNQIAGSLIQGCSFALNLAKMVSVWRNPNKDALDRTTVVVKAGLSTADTFFAGAALGQTGPTPPVWLSQGRKLTGAAGMFLALATGVREGKPQHELMLATLPKEYVPIRLGVDLTKLVEKAMSNDPQHGDVQVVPSLPWAGVPSGLALKHQLLTDLAPEATQLPRESVLRK